MISVAVFGAAGRVGSEICRAVESDPELQLTACIDPSVDGEGTTSKVPWYASADAMSDEKPHVAIDFTMASAAVANIEWCIRNGVHAVVGTTGIEPSEIERLRNLRTEHGHANVLLAPNFAIGAVLLMRFSEMAARWMPDAEIIELHHPGKLDAPSGTALKTAEAIAAARTADVTASATEPASRGGDVNDVRVHSVRLPGLVAHQEVIFGGQGQTLTLRHDSTDRTSFIPGVLLAVKKISSTPGFTVGLERILDL